MRKDTCNVSKCFLCTHCIPVWKELIAIKKSTIRFRKGERLFSEGDKVTGIFFVYSGGVKVHKQWVDRKELILRFAKEGDILGHRGLAAGDQYPVSATALEETVGCFIDNNFLDTILKSDHSLTYRLMHFYAAELQKAELRMRNLALMEVQGRIAEALLEMQNVFGMGKDKYILVPVTRQDISAYAGTTYETVFKFLKSITSKKIISVSGKHIRINQVEKLKTFIREVD